MRSDPIFELQTAWRWREICGAFECSQAARVFYGPGEGQSLRSIAIDKFSDHYWITAWETKNELHNEKAISSIITFLKSKNALSAVLLFRPKGKVPGDPRILFGEPPSVPLVVNEHGASFLIRFLNVKHPGLFLDHLPLRLWLTKNSAGLRVLNTFSYTGSLSVAAGIGGATEVVSIDLSKTTSGWAKENWDLNKLSGSKGNFIAGDVFEWLPRSVRKSEKFDIIILDPPSFSRSKKTTFSTAKDLQTLHKMAIKLLAPQGFIITSINSEDISLAKFESDLAAAAKSLPSSFVIVEEIHLPSTFPTELGYPAERYLKGFILRAL